MNFKAGTVSCFALSNRKSRLFVPSKKNKFGVLNYEKVMIDSGCGSLLLPLNQEVLETITKEYNSNDYVWKISKSKGVSAEASVLIIEKAMSNFNVCISEDIFECKLEVTKLRFHICSEDSALILNNLKDYSKLASYKDKLEAFKDKNIKRRTHVLLGQVICRDQRSASFQTVDILIGYKELYDFSMIKDDLIMLLNRKKDMKESYGLEFEDLEDEDHDCVDDAEDYHIDEEDLIDEDAY